MFRKAEARPAFVEFLTSLYGAYATLQSRQPNQRKVFQAVVSKLLWPALKLRQSVGGSVAEGSAAAKLIEQVGCRLVVERGASIHVDMVKTLPGVLVL